MHMTSLTSDNIRQALMNVIDRDTGKDVLAQGMISGLTLQGGKVSFIITVPLAEAKRKEYLREVCERAVAAVHGVDSVTAVLTAESSPREGSAHGQPQRPAQWNLTPVEGVKRIVAIASGKGGVGKSTVAAALAQGIAASGHGCGLLDADIYGPSVPRIMGLREEGQPPVGQGKMIPPVAHGVQCMSMGFITGDEAAILRGPMITKALHQLLRMTQWGKAGAPLDVLLVDMPPGTGDVHLSLAQAAPLSGAVIVTTPQEVALEDARKAVKMFLKLDIPVLGVVENMTGEVFGRGGGDKLAREFGVPLLAEIPLEGKVREAADAGTRLGYSFLQEAMKSILG